MSRHVNAISGRLSLRDPQRESLEILDRVMEIAQPHKGGDPSKVLAAIRAEERFQSVEDFERAFPSLCFALATGVGKTRLMGAFISYLYLEHGIRNFFVLAPNLTIYNKLVVDFTPNTPKYVFQGIAEFAVKAPAIVTGDNYEDVSARINLFQDDDVTINVFNIAKFASRSKDARKVWRLSELLGQSYFDYLAGLDDLVILMDEAHRYRAGASMKSIEDLDPVLGIELTATPQVQSGTRKTPFKNVIYNYPLAAAMRDGYVKEPAVGTRRDFDHRSMSEAQLDQLKLEDGVRLHEAVKVHLEVYAQENGFHRVKPFMLVVATETDHANEIVALIESEAFFEGRYKGRVIQVHSGQSGEEKDENVARLLAVEDPDEKTEIVVHVNMLKEGWDVTNLYTIVPLRAAASSTLVEQTIGRGLRLPYGKRTGVIEVDTLTVVAHDRFQEIVDEAKKGGYSFRTLNVDEADVETRKQSVVAAPVVESILGLQPAAVRGDGSAESVALPAGSSASAPPRFETEEQRAVARLALDAIRRAARDTETVSGPAALGTEAVQERLVADVKRGLTSGQLPLFTDLDDAVLAEIVKETSDVYLANTIAIPRVIVHPTGEVRAGFRAFQLELADFRLQPVSREILVQNLVSDRQQIIGALEGGHQEERFEDYVVRGLIDFDDVSYDDHADLLYDLAAQFVAHLRGYLANDDEVRNVLLFHQRTIANLVHAQMQNHSWEEATSYEAFVSSGFTEIRQQAFVAPEDQPVRQFDVPINNRSEIRSMLFGGFQRCLYPTQKFDSDSERRFAVLLERDETVEKWFKPGKGVFQIRYTGDHDYEPDFVVETRDAKLLCEPKNAGAMKDQTVIDKARAAATWCENASRYELENGGKPWKYLLIPHDQIKDNMSLEGLIRSWTVEQHGGTTA
ncbi:MAG: DEAD/DEAH box helicase family protein [Planctomycetes bacterium]|nr:DEAD/DEAH box helicase family protein [Planctomycetota bacterium]